MMMRIIRLHCNIRGLVQSGVGVSARCSPFLPGKRRRSSTVPLSRALQRSEQDSSATGEYVRFLTHRGTLEPPAQRSHCTCTASALVQQTRIALLSTYALVKSASGPSPPPLSSSSSSSSSSSCSPPSRRQDGQDALQSASRDQQNQLLLVGPRELIVEEAREDRVVQPRLRLPGRPGWSRRQPGSCAGEQHEFAAAADAQEAAGRSAEQIHQPDPGLAEQVSTRMELDGRRGGGGRHDPLWVQVSDVSVLLFAPSTLHFYHHVTVRGRRGEEEG